MLRQFCCCVRRLSTCPMAAAAKKRKADKEEQERGQSRKKAKKEPSEHGQSAAQKTEPASSQKSKNSSDKNANEEQTEECFRQAALGLRSLSGDLESVPSAATADSEPNDKGSAAAAAEVIVKEEKVDSEYEDSSSKAVSDCSHKDQAEEAKDDEVEVKVEPMEQAGDEDEDSDDADILLKIQKQCATIQSRGGGGASKNVNHAAEATCVADQKFRLTEPGSRPEVEEAEVVVNEEGGKCEPLNSQWSIVSEVRGIKTEPMEECCLESSSIKVEDIKEEVREGERERQVGAEKVEPKDEPVEAGGDHHQPNGAVAEGSSQLQISGVYSADAAVMRENADRMTAAAALTAVGQPLVGQPLVGQPPVAQLAQHPHHHHHHHHHQLLLQRLPAQPPSSPAAPLTQTTLAPAAHTLIQLASSSPAQQILLTGALRGTILHTTHQNPLPNHQVLVTAAAVAAAQPHHPQVQQVQPQEQAGTLAEHHQQVQPHKQLLAPLSSSAGPVSSFLEDADLQAEEAAAFEVLAEWSSMSAAHQQMTSGGVGAMMDDEHTNDSMYSSSSNGDSSNSNNGGYDLRKVYLPSKEVL